MAPHGVAGRGCRRECLSNTKARAWVLRDWRLLRKPSIVRLAPKQNKAQKLPGGEPPLLQRCRIFPDHETDQKDLRLTLHVQDCIQYVALNGSEIRSKQNRCRNCRITSSSDHKPHCQTTVLRLKPNLGENTLAVQTKNVRGPSRSYNIDQTVFWVEYQRGGFLWKLVFLIVSIFGLAWMISALRYRSLRRFLIMCIGRIKRYRVVLFGYLLVCTLRVVVSPAHLTTDVNQATHLYVENLIHKTDFSYATLDADYKAAKHQGRSYAKPACYQYVPARMYFGI